MSKKQRKQQKPKRRNVKFDPKKRLRSIAKFNLNNKVVVADAADKSALLFDTKMMKTIKVTSNLFNTIHNVAFKWKIFIAVLSRDPFGKEFMQGEWIESKEPYHHYELIDFFER